MGTGNAPARDYQSLHPLRDQTAQRDVIGFAGGQPLEESPFALRVMNIQGIGASGNCIIKLAPV